MRTPKLTLQLVSKMQCNENAGASMKWTEWLTMYGMIEAFRLIIVKQLLKVIN